MEYQRDNMENQALNIVNGAVFSVTISKTLQLFSAFLLATIIVYGVGFAQMPEAHNAAHDVRHSQGFACH